MWKCEIFQNHGYKGYLRAYLSVLHHTLYDSEKDYGSLINNTGKIFAECKYNDFHKRSKEFLVEPRELLMLLNYVDTAPTMYYAPRPFMRMGNLADDFVYILPTTNTFKLENKTLACLFCGVIQAMPRYLFEKKCLKRLDTIHDKDMSDVTRWRLTLNDEKVGTTRFTYKTEEILKQLSAEKVPHYRHDESCPLLWLSSNENSAWNTKKSILYVNEMSSFKSVLRAFNCGLKTEDEWIEFALTLSRNQDNHGCSEKTMVYLYDSLVEYKLCVTPINGILDTGDSYKVANQTERRGHLHYEPRSVVQHGSAIGDEDIFEAHEDERGFKSLNLSNKRNAIDGLRVQSSQIPVNFGLSKEYDIARDVDDNMFVRDMMAVRERPFLTRTYEEDGRIVIIPKDDQRLHDCLKRVKVMHGFLTGYKDNLICLYCGNIFDETLLPWEFCRTYYDLVEQRKIVKYVNFSLSRHEHNGQQNNDPRYLSHKFFSLTILDVIRNIRIDRIADKNRVYKIHSEDKTGLDFNMDAFHHRICLWLSATMDTCHASDCIFKFKRYVYDQSCHLCGSNGNSGFFSCGHILCVPCYNDIRITDCPKCSKGVRQQYVL